ncbi:MAG TPA: hypothetical protein VD970_11150, partial [Acetobacteraceae bacterium]|nr:hypothetical protein [Acetobacteraceae bacterium]
KLHTGKSFALPFDALVVFSTNMSPSQLMDEAFLRRIPHKIEVPAPSAEQFRTIFRSVAARRHIEVNDRAIDFVVSELTERNSFSLAGYQPGFLLDQAEAFCKFEGRAPQVDEEILSFGLSNLYTKDSPGRRDSFLPDISQPGTAPGDRSFHMPSLGAAALSGFKEGSRVTHQAAV